VRVLIDYRSALRARSGAGEYCHQLSMALATAFPPDGGSRPLALTIFSSSWKDRLRVPPPLSGATTVDRRIPVSLLNFSWHRLEWPPAEMLAGASFDVAHSFHPLLLPVRRGAQVITIHDLNFLAHPERTRGEVRRDYPALVREHAHRADRVVVPSRFTAAEVERQLALPVDRIAICPPGAPAWTPRASTPRTGYILFVSTLEPRKNVGALLDAYALLLEGGGAPELVLAGHATGDAKAWLDRADRPPLAGRVRHVGYVAGDSLRELYNGAAVFVQPSFEEGFGLPVLEAMTAGVPVVASNRGSLPEVLGDAGVLVDPESPEAIAAGLRRVLSDPAFAQSSAERGIARSRTFQWSETALRVYEVYRQAIDRHAHRN
jgi:glycosyltransferase involved in cell wall biosynthesis